jgi:DNA-binding LacI/PurR family transcriptional regulator
MFEPPKRVLLSEQIQAILRDGLSGGRWERYLPTELTLCRELEIGRKTLRTALSNLASDGWIELGGRGRLHRILRGPSQGLRAPKTRGHVIRYLSPIPFGEMGNVSMGVFEALAERLGRHGFVSNHEHRPGLYRRFSRKEMERLASMPDTAGWVLLSATPEMQSWFEARKIPCVVTGSLHAGVRLPSVAFDYHAACRHAAHHLFSKGHRHVAYITPRMRSASDELSVAGFLSATPDHPGGRRLLIIEHDHTVEGICRAMDLELAGIEPPTGYLVSGGMDLLTVISHLWRRGWSVPEHASFIVRSDEVVLERLVPRFAYYSLDAAKMGRTAAELLTKILERNITDLKPRIILPEFIAGETVTNPWPKKSAG